MPFCSIAFLAGMFTSTPVEPRTNQVNGIRELHACTIALLPVQISGTVIRRMPWNKKLNTRMLLVDNEDGSAGVRIDSGIAAKVGDHITARGITSFKDQIGMIVDYPTVEIHSRQPPPPARHRKTVQHLPGQRKILKTIFAKLGAPGRPEYVTIALRKHLLKI